MLYNYTVKAKQHSKMDQMEPKVFLRNYVNLSYQ